MMLVFADTSNRSACDESVHSNLAIYGKIDE